MMGSKLKFGYCAGLGFLGMILACAGCGSTGGNGGSNANAANMAIFVQGQPVQGVSVQSKPTDNILALQVTVDSASITDSSGHNTSLGSAPQPFELRHMELAPSLALQTASLPPGSYTTLNLTLANPQLTVFASGAVTQVTNASLASSSISIPLSNFSLAASGTQGLALNFDLQSSIKVDGNGNISITPVLTEATVATVAPASSSGPQLVDVVGQIMAMPASPANAFDFQIANVPNTARLVTDGNTLFDASIGKFSSLQVSQFVEVEAQVQKDGTYLAKSIELSAAPSVRNQGVVTSVQQTSQGGTVLNFVVQD